MALINLIIIAIRRKFFEEYSSNALLLVQERFFCAGRLRRTSSWVNIFGSQGM